MVWRGNVYFVFRIQLISLLFLPMLHRPCRLLLLTLMICATYSKGALRRDVESETESGSVRENLDDFNEGSGNINLEIAMFGEYLGLQ